MLGQNSPIDPVVRFTDQLRHLAAEVGELKRLWSIPRHVAGVTTATTDSNGIVIVTHNLPFTPSGVVGTPRSTNHSQHRIDNISATTFRYRAWSPTGTPVATASITFQWNASR